MRERGEASCPLHFSYCTFPMWCLLVIVQIRLASRCAFATSYTWDSKPAIVALLGLDVRSLLPRKILTSFEQKGNATTWWEAFRTC